MKNNVLKQKRKVKKKTIKKKLVNINIAELEKYFIKGPKNLSENIDSIYK